MDSAVLAAGQVEQTVDLMRAAAGAMKSVTCSPIAEAKAVHAAAHALLAREADLLAQIDESRAHESEGCASVATWASREFGDGLPATGGVKPHVSIIVDADTLKHNLNRGKDQEHGHGDLMDRTPAILEGFGPIGPALLTYLLHGADLTAILTEKHTAGFKANKKVLDAQRLKRVATDKQRRIIGFRQKGICANRGCHHPIGEVHHVIDWAHGGKTNLDNLTGLCRKRWGHPHKRGRSPWGTCTHHHRPTHHDRHL